MKRVLPLLALLRTAASADTFIEVRDSQPRVGRNLLLINPGDLFSGVLSLEYEGALSPRASGLPAASRSGAFAASSHPPRTLPTP